MTLNKVFPGPFTHGGEGVVPPPYRGGQSINGGTHEGGHRPYGGDLTCDKIIS